MTEDRAISLNAVFEQIKAWMNYELRDMTNPIYYLEKRLRDLPPVKPQPKTGHWVKTPYGDCKCSKCNSIFPQLPISYFEPRYCHNCGADMRSDNDGR